MENESFDAETPRRSTRLRKPTSKALENKYVKTLARSGFVGNISSSEESSSENEEFITENEPITPSVLQNTDHVQGDKIFQFQSRKTKRGLFQKVKEAHELKEEKNLGKAARKARHTEEDEPFSDSGSEYNASEDSSSESDHKISGSDSSEESHGESVKKKQGQAFSGNRKMGKAQLRGQREKNYKIHIDDYFSNQATKKIVTSDYTLDKLETPRLSQDQLTNLLKNMKLSKNHFTAINQLQEQNKTMFTKWLYLLHENFNILIYGLGSKRRILTEFQEEFLTDYPVIVVNGFFPSLSIKDILDGIISDLLQLKRNPANVYECCDIIEKEFGYLDTHLYLIVHNIDGEVLRNSKTQNVLARLACIDNIHLIASTDHINGPLMWDHSKLDKFNYTWWDMTSFLPYIEETSFESSMMIQKGGEFALSSLRNVFLSLTKNSRGIYLLMVKHQLKNSKNQLYQGFAFKDLYSSCRETFLVSSDLALRAQLTEFIDHKMVKIKRSADGVENLVIPISNALLEKFLNEQKD
ncbi:origin recognition complex subunit 2 isoform X2 [Coccinella septempunctata]|uniref:origin recognition complex subunit 2 isoform X2 n=1 Tax=Coccinella septempunctata TaxID=41139 RepID=UPI001D089B5D|nr:origin recognition complex subunit 2 isoform X2 [Coccinella septempunctata]